MATIRFYGIIGVKFSENKKHPRFISDVMAIAVTTENNYKIPAKKYTKDEAIELSPLYTMKWDYDIGDWVKGAVVDTEVKDKITYLRSRRNDTETDNLSNLIEFDSFV